jgi:hypothetical protein
MKTTNLFAACLLVLAQIPWTGCSSEECSSRDRITCLDGTTYWLDSCGDVDELIERCECGCSGEDACKLRCDCTSHQDVACEKGKVFWIDSCGQQEEPKETCECGCDATGKACKSCECPKLSLSVERAWEELTHAGITVPYDNRLILAEISLTNSSGQSVSLSPGWFRVATGSGVEYQALVTGFVDGECPHNGFLETGNQIECSLASLIPREDIPTAISYNNGEVSVSAGIESFEEACRPKSCVDLNVGCGVVDDGCGADLSCGECPTWSSHGESWDCINNQCVCVPGTCTSTGCGVMDNGCGGNINCGDCNEGYYCNSWRYSTPYCEVTPSSFRCGDDEYCQLGYEYCREHVTGTMTGVVYESCINLPEPCLSELTCACLYEHAEFDPAEYECDPPNIPGALVMTKYD